MVERLLRRIQTGRGVLVGGDLRGALAVAGEVVLAASETDYAPLIASAHLLQARVLRALARSDAAEVAAETGLLAADAAGDDRGAAEGWLERARIAGARGRFIEAARHTRHADAAILRAGSPDDLADELLHLRGVVRTNLGELHEAELDLRGALDSMGRRLGRDAPRLASLHTSLGNALRVESLLDAALLEHQRALAIDTTALGEDHARVGRDLHNVGGILRRLERADEALDHYTRALAIKRAALGDEHPEVALTRNSLGLMASERGDLEEARRQWEMAVESFFAQRHGDEALVRFNLALIDLEESRWSEAHDHVARAIEIDTARIGPRTKRVGSEHVILARALIELHRFEEARQASAEAVAIGEELPDDELERGGREQLARAHQPTRTSAPPARRTGPVVRTPRADPGAVRPPSEPPVPRPSPPAPVPSGSGSYGAGQAWE